MDQGTNNNSKKYSKAVHLKLGSPVSVQKGRTLVGRLETDKNLNRGIVISMIKKGWGLDKDMEIHELPDNNAFLFRFPKLDDFNRVLKGRPWSIQGALLNLQHWDELTVFHEVFFGWCPFWIQFHGLPHIAFDNDNAVTLGSAVGKVVMYEAPTVRARNCKFPTNDSEEDDSENRVGNGLGTPHVRTVEDAVVIHDQSWDEAVVRTTRPPSRAKTSGDWRKNGDSAQYGNMRDQGVSPAPRLLHNISLGNGQNYINEPVNVQMQQGFQVVELPGIMETISRNSTLSSHSMPTHVTPSVTPIASGNYYMHGGSFAPSPFNEVDLGNGQDIKSARANSSTKQEINGKMISSITDLMGANQITPPSTLPLHQNPTVIPPPIIAQTPIHLDPPNLSNSEPITQPDSLPYRVEFPDHDADPMPTPLPLAGLSPISAVTTSLNQFHLKRSHDPLEEEPLLNPTKKRLLFLELGPSPVPTHLDQTPTPTPEFQRVSHRKIKSSIRNKKSKLKVKPTDLSPSINSSSDPPLGPQPPNYTHNPSLSLESPKAADGCHQAAIGSP
ncbi:hypothetical protein K1719_007469 [Acacia pycnantha]|nr:hypothetical protein K1719_007469 [Acacia pycnantha]